MTMVSGVHSDCHVTSSRTYALNQSINDILVQALQHGFALQPLSCSICKTPLIKLVEDNENHDLSNRTKPTVSISTSTAAFKKSTKDFLSEHMPECFMKGICFCVKCKAHVVTSDAELSLLEDINSSGDPDKFFKGSVIVGITGKGDTVSIANQEKNRPNTVFSPALESDYVFRRDLASEIISVKLQEGYILREILCRKCEMPLMSTSVRDDLLVCVVCPALPNEKKNKEESLLNDSMDIASLGNKLIRERATLQDLRTTVENQYNEEIQRESTLLNTCAESLRKSEEETTAVIEKLSQLCEQKSKPYQSAETERRLIEDRARTLRVLSDEALKVKEDLFVRWRNIENDTNASVFDKMTLKDDYQLADNSYVVLEAQSSLIRQQLMKTTFEVETLAKQKDMYERPIMQHIQNLQDNLIEHKKKCENEIATHKETLEKAEARMAKLQLIFKTDDDVSSEFRFDVESQSSLSDILLQLEHVLTLQELLQRLKKDTTDVQENTDSVKHVPADTTILEQPADDVRDFVTVESTDFPATCYDCSQNNQAERSEKDVMKNEIQAMITREVGARLMKGWKLLDSPCPQCTLPLMTEREGAPSTCVVCGLTAQCAPKKIDDKELEALISREIGVRLLNGWHLLDSACPRCTAPMMSETDGGTAVCIMCGSNTVTESIEDEFNEFVKREIGDRVLEGWQVLNSTCPKCVIPLMSAKQGSGATCVVCGQIVQVSGNDERKIEELISREIGVRVLEGWMLLDSACPKCSLPLMSENKESAVICLLCGAISSLPLSTDNHTRGEKLSGYGFLSSQTASKTVNGLNLMDKSILDDSLESVPEDMNKMFVSSVTANGFSSTQELLSSSFPNLKKGSIVHGLAVENNRPQHAAFGTDALLSQHPRPRLKPRSSTATIGTLSSDTIEDVSCYVLKAHEMDASTRAICEVTSTSFAETAALTCNMSEQRSLLVSSGVSPDVPKILNESNMNTRNENEETSRGALMSAEETIVDMIVGAPSIHDTPELKLQNRNEDEKAAINSFIAATTGNSTYPQEEESIRPSRSVAILTLKALEQKIDAAKARLSAPLCSDDIVKDLVSRLEVISTVEKLAEAAAAIKKEALLE